MTLFYKKIETPVGNLTLVARDMALTHVLWENECLGTSLTLRPDWPILLQAEKQLREYFLGTRSHFDLPLEFLGTPFQREVWQALQKIPFGKTMSYSQLAQSIHRPKASRAVGAANKRNPFSIVVPCHRVIGANGHLTGFAGGLDIKQFLLQHEAKNESLHCTL